MRPNWGLCQCVRVLRSSVPQHLQLHARRPQIACGSCTTAQYVPLTCNYHPCAGWTVQVAARTCCRPPASLRCSLCRSLCRRTRPRHHRRLAVRDPQVAGAQWGRITQSVAIEAERYIGRERPGSTCTASLHRLAVVFSSPPDAPSPPPPRLAADRSRCTSLMLHCSGRHHGWQPRNSAENARAAWHNHVCSRVSRSRRRPTTRPRRRRLAVRPPEIDDFYVYGTSRVGATDNSLATQPQTRGQQWYLLHLGRRKD